jgi:hypothetical protein
LLRTLARRAPDPDRWEILDPGAGQASLGRYFPASERERTTASEGRLDGSEKVDLGRFEDLAVRLIDESTKSRPRDAGRWTVKI